MAFEKMLVSKLGASVAITAEGTYTTISGIMNLQFEVETETVDTSTLDNNKWATSIPGLMTGNPVLEGYRIADIANGGLRDAGQKMAEKAAITQELRYWRIFLKSDPTQYIQFPAYAKGLGFGGGVNEALPWKVELLLQDEPTFEGEFFDPETV